MKLKNVSLSILALLLTANISLAAPANKVSPIDKKLSDINKCIENNDYRGADSLIYQSVLENPSEVQFKIASAISLTQQDKLDLAQDILDSIKKSSLKYADYYYAQAAVYLKRIDTSNMRFRAKNDTLIQLAINQLNYSLKINPKNAKVYNALGVAELKRGDLYQAQVNFEKALQVNQHYSTALDNLGSVYYITNELDKAESYYKKAMTLNPTSATLYYHLAQVAYKKDDLQKALYYTNKSLDLSPKSTYAYNLLGEVYRKQGNEAAAITAFKKSIFLMPENAEAYINLAGVYESRGDLSAAIEELKTCYSVIPDNDTVKLNLADMILSSGQYEDAIKYYSEVSDKYKTEAIEGIASAYFSLATETANKSMFKSNRRLADALVYIDKAIKENPDNLELYLTKSKLARLVHNQVESKEVLLKVVSAPNVNISGLLTKGDAYIALQQYRDARNVFAQAVKIDKDVESDLNLAEYFTYNKQYRAAKDALQNVLSKEPENAEAMNNLLFINKTIEKSNEQYKNAVHFKKEGDKFFQKVYLNKSLKLDPNNIESNLMLAKLLKKEKDIYGANNCYKNVLGASDNEKQIKKVARLSKKLDKKIAKLEAKKDKKAIKDNKIKEDNKVVPINNDSKETSKEHIIPAVNEQSVEVEQKN